MNEIPSYLRLISSSLDEVSVIIDSCTKTNLTEP